MAKGSGSLPMLAAALFGTIAVGIDIFSVVARVMNVNQYVDYWSLIMTAIGTFIAWSGAFFSVVAFGSRGIAGGAFLFIYFCAMGLLKVITLGMAEYTFWYSAQIASFVFWVLFTIMCGVSIPFTIRRRREAREMTASETNYKVSKATFAWGALAMLGGTLYVVANVLTIVNNMSEVTIYWIFSFLNAVAGPLALSYSPFVMTMTLPKQCPEGITPAQIAGLNLGGLICSLGWIIAVIPAVFVPINYWIDTNEVDGVSICIALAAVCFTAASIGYDVTHRRIRRYIQRHANNNNNHHHHHDHVQPMPAPGKGYQAMQNPSVNSAPPAYQYQQPSYQQAPGAGYQVVPPAYQQQAGPPAYQPQQGGAAQQLPLPPNVYNEFAK